MALLSYLLDDPRPRRVRDQLFGVDLSDDFFTDVFERPRSARRYVRPWRRLSAVGQELGSKIKTDKDKFQINLDVQHFDPEEISVKISDGHVVIEGKHEERKDEHGYISRQFKRRYALPEKCNPDTIESKLSSDGVLTVVAPKISESKYERAVPITHTGPVRREHHDEEQNSEAAKEEKNSEAAKEEKNSEPAKEENNSEAVKEENNSEDAKEEKSPQKKRRR